jgi:putative toxin-antitoxin system antitoxin component (TIGR02293 family)
MPVIDLLERLREFLAVTPLDTEQDVARLVEDRLPLTALDALRAIGLTDEEVFALVLPRRTLSHRRARRERLSVDESDRVVRILRVTAAGESVFGERERFWRWFRTPNSQFDGRTPLSLLTTDAGARVVEDMLVAIDEGFAA